MTPLPRLNACRFNALLAATAAAAVLVSGCKDDPPPAVVAGTPAKAVAGKEDSHGKDDGLGKEEAGHAEGKAIRLSEDEQRVAGVRVEPVEVQEVADQLVVTATIQANQDRLARLAPRVPGRIVGIAANLGDRVSAGQVLARLDSIEVGEARSSYAQLESEARVARGNMERAERLQAEQVVSQKDYLRARAEHEKAQAALRAAGDKLTMLGLGGDKADGLSTFPLAAPFGGTVIEKHAVLGELAQPDKPIFGIADLSVLWIEASLPEKDLPRVKVGDAAFISVAAYPGERISGKLTYLGSVMDKETRTLRSRIEVRNADGRLKPEMFATAAIQTRSMGKAIVLPDEALVLVSGQQTVFVQDSDGFEPRTVEAGDRLQGRTVVKAGLKPGERVVTAGTYALKARMLKSLIGEGHAH